MSHDIDEVISTANSLLDSIHEEFVSVFELPPNTPSTPRVSSTVQTVLNDIDRCLQEIPDRSVAVQEAVASNNEYSVLIVEIPNPITPARSTEHVVDVIDLCSDTPENNASRLRNPPQSHSPEVIDLVSPTTTETKRRTKLKRRSLETTNKETDDLTDKRQKSSDESTANTKSKDMICAICMESYTSNQPTTTKCGHVFCRQCIVKSLQATQNCPICRRKINSRSLIRIHL